ncbi:MAG: hypothetical protein ACAF41_00545 (plasmid) [Leptolyngbya sp. BL-A-14]
MSADRTNDDQTRPSRPLENMTPAVEATSAVEAEISDETLEAVAGGGDANPPLTQSAVNQP